MTPAGNAIADLLASGGVRRFYTVPGESFLEILDGVDRHPDIRLISTRHESGAAFMGEADAKMTGRPAVVAATRAVGAANLAIGVHTAMQDSTPMVVLLGQADTKVLGREAFQEIDLDAFYRPITKLAITAHRTDRIPELVSEALRVAQSGRPGPVMIAFPADVLAGQLDDEDITVAARRISASSAAPGADHDACAYLAKRLADAERPVILAGGGARHAREELIAVAGAYEAGIYSAFRRQDIFPNDHRLYLGHLGLGVGPDVVASLRDADLVVVLGSRLSEVTTAGYTLPSPASEMIQVDIDAGVVGAIAPLRLGIVADVKAVLIAVLGAAADQTIKPRDWSLARAAYQDAARIPASRAAAGVDPAQVIRAMAEVLPADAVVANDAGNFSAFLHTHWAYVAPRSQVAPTSGAMGYAVPAAIGAKLAAPDRVVVGLAGDGGFTMSAMELETAVREGVDATFLVFRNGLHGTIAMHQARSSGRLAGVHIGEVHVADLARSLGASGHTVSSDDALVPALDHAVRTPGPSVVEILTDPDVLSPRAKLSDLLSAHGAAESHT